MSQSVSHAQKYNFPVFTKEMIATHTVLIPGMLPIHFSLLRSALNGLGYHAEILSDTSQDVIETGLRYVNNDICYPALLAIGQLIHALESGKYDLEHTALMLSQTGGGCRASNYIYLLRKALEKAGLEHIPVISMNVMGMEDQSGFKMNISMMRRLLAACVYGDELMYLTNKIRPYEMTQGSAEQLAQSWLAKLDDIFMKGKAQAFSTMKKLMPKIAQEFASLPTQAADKIKVGIVGEIYIKYSALGNNNLEAFLQKQNCEYMLPGLMNFLMYCVDTFITDYKLYGGKKLTYAANKTAFVYLQYLEKILHDALNGTPLKAPATYTETKAMAKGIIGYGNNMGEGWLLTAEMLELAQSGYKNIICAQPFGCLPNHIAGRGMVNKIKQIAVDANIMPLDFDASASRVNQENRIKLMLATAEK
ncbi:MAG: 2-hydroxyacyl-CoA dehydratase [Phascolarctobacterium sp.]|nr:2-hydroxyacyl-CoA dehydratase [Phascolarctobacterium sp.]